MPVVELFLSFFGLTIVFLGATLGVRSASRLAATFGLSELVIGATVVAVGTSSPEVVVSTIAALQGADGVAVGNVAGSNVFNVGLVLGLSAFLAPMAVHRQLISREIPLLLIATMTALLLMADGDVGRAEGGILLLWLIVYLYVVYRAPGLEALEGAAQLPVVAGARALPWVDALLLVVALVGLALGAELFVRSASTVAREFGVEEFAIGATIAAVGTGLPELATSVIAAARRRSDLAVGNIVGSNIFNLLSVLGLAALASPIAVDRRLYQFEFPLLLASSLVLFGLVWPGYQLGRRSGSVLMLGYATFVVATVWRAA